MIIGNLSEKLLKNLPRPLHLLPLVSPDEFGEVRCPDGDGERKLEERDPLLVHFESLLESARAYVCACV